MNKETARIKNVIDTPLIFFFKNRKKLHINIRKKI